MLKILSNSRKKKPASKLASSTAKQPRQSHKEQKQYKQVKHTAKHNHHASTLTLLSHHNASVASHASLLGQSKSNAVKKRKSHKHKESTLSLMHKDGKEAGNKQKQKSKTHKQGKKINKNSSLNPNSKSKKNIIKISPQKNEKLPKQNPSKKRNVTRQQQLYQRINIGLFKSKTNSQINFSSSSSVRQNHNANNLQQSRNKKILTIDCSDQYILNQYFSNSRIKNHEKKRNQSAIKIQKVFRGYMTRKILKAYTQKIEHQFQQFGKKKKNIMDEKQMLRVSPNKNKQYFNNINLQNDDKTKKLVRKISNEIFIQENSERESKSSKDNRYKKINQIQPIDFEISLRNSRKQVLPPIDHAALEQQSSIIGNQQSLSRYLPFQQKYITIRSQKQEYYQQNECEDDIHKQNYDIKQQFQQKSQSDYFKLTPIVSSQHSKSKDQPIPTDFSEKRIPQFQFDVPIKSKQIQANYHKKGKITIQYTQTSVQNFNIHSGNNSIQFMKKSKQIQKSKQINNNKYFKNINPNQNGNQINNNIQRKQKTLIKTLKKQQQQKWNKIILMLNQQIRYSKEQNQDNNKFMNMILQFSKKNKEQLQKSTSFIEDSSNNINKQLLKQKKDDKCNFKLFNKNKNRKEQQQQLQYDQDLNLTTQLIRAEKQKIIKNQNMPLIRKKNHNQSLGDNKQNLCQTLLEKTEQLKNIYRKNYSAYPIEQMIQIREQALERRQKQTINKLNQDLYNSLLTHEQFITRLAQMQQQFEKQRQLIMKSKTQIFVGYKATHKLMQDSLRDACYLGCKIPFSQSLKDFKQNYMGNNLWVKELIVDQLRSFATNGNTLNMSGSIKFTGAKKITNINTSNNMLNNSNSNSIINNYNKKQNNQISLLEQDQSYNKQRQSQRKREDLSISLPYQDSNMTPKPQLKSNQISQQSVYSQQISYNEGEVEIHNLGLQTKPDYIFDDSSSQQQQQEFSQKQQKIQGFKKIDPQRIARRSYNSNHHEMQGPLLLDPDQQQQIDNIVIKKISINQKRITNYDIYNNFEHLNRTDMTPRNSSINQPKSEVYKVDFGSQQSEQDQKANQLSKEIPVQIKQITQLQVTKLIWEVTGQIYINMHMRSKFCKIKHKAPQKITYQEQTKFVEMLQKQIPNFEQVQPRLNQKMTANRLQLLRFLRVNFDDDDQQQGSYINQIEYGQNQDGENFNQGKVSSRSNQGFEQIGKFQHILSTDICTNILNNYLQQSDKINNNKILNLHKQNNQQILVNKVKQQLKQKVSLQCIKKVTERQKSHTYNEMQKNDLRRQITKIECHCIFDSLNQIIIRRRIKFNGYSGIGLNELTMIMKNQYNYQMKDNKQYKQLIGQSMKELKELLSVQKTSGQKLLLQNYQRLCQNDSQWIYYTQQALSFALEFVYMLEDQIFFEEAACIFKKGYKL